jgi:ubiquitin-conjugating enzyme E2 Z
MSIRTKRLLIEVKKIQEYNQTNIDNIYILSYEEDINKFMAIILGPKDSLYEGGIFLFDIYLPDDYPFQPPKFTFISPNFSKIGRIHPNLYENGKVCLSILNTWGSEEWSSSLNLISICKTIQSLLDNNPILHEPPNNRVDNNYKIAAKYKSLKMTKDIYNKRTLLPEFICLKIQEKYIENKEVYTKLSLEFNDPKLNNTKITYFHGNFDIHYDMISKW